MEIRTLGPDDVDEFAERSGVVRFGEHLETDPPASFRAWIGAPEPHERVTLAAREGGRARARSTAVAVPRAGATCQIRGRVEALIEPHLLR